MIGVDGIARKANWSDVVEEDRCSQQFAVRDLLCLTVYNEPVNALQLSFDSLVCSLSELARDNSNTAKHFGVCLIFDGVMQASADTLVWLQEKKWLPSKPFEQCTGWHTGTMSIAASSSDSALSVPIWVLVKEKNLGKLDSHAQFFDGLCAILQPRHVYQLDAGTVLAPGALREVIRCFDSDENIGAISSRCAAEAPICEDGIVPAWQFFDTTQQLSAQWPIECLSGYLSVIPGQFCAFRWSALYQGGIDDSPLRHYLHGLEADSLYTKIMFLAEDRVVGHALTLAPDKEWKLEYGVGVQATNDACSTLPELMRQRRRWNNGSNACRLYFLSRWYEFLRRDDRSLLQKLRFSAAVLWQVLIFVTQILSPAVFATYLELSVSAVKSCWQDEILLPPIALGVSILVGVAGWRGLMGRHVRLLAVVRDGVWWVALLAIIASLAHVASFSAVAFLFAAQFLVVCMTNRLYKGHGAVLWRRFAEYFWVDPIMRLLLWTYSLSKLNDTAWGTKGLNAARDTIVDWRTAWALPLWTGLNVAAYFLCLNRSGILFSDLPLLTELGALFGYVSVTGSIVFFGLRSLKTTRGAKSARNMNNPLQLTSKSTGV